MYYILFKSIKYSNELNLWNITESSLVRVWWSSSMIWLKRAPERRAAWVGKARWRATPFQERRRKRSGPRVSSAVHAHYPQTAPVKWVPTNGQCLKLWLLSWKPQPRKDLGSPRLYWSLSEKRPPGAPAAASLTWSLHLDSWEFCIEVVMALAS